MAHDKEPVNWYNHPFKNRYNGQLIYKMQYSRISCFFQCFTPFAISKKFNKNIAQAVYMIGVHLESISYGIITIKCKKDIVSLLKKFSVIDFPNKPDHYVKYYPIVRALFVAFHSKYRSRHLLYFQVMYHHYTLKQDRKNNKKPLFHKSLCFE